MTSGAMPITSGASSACPSQRRPPMSTAGSTRLALAQVSARFSGEGSSTVPLVSPGLSAAGAAVANTSANAASRTRESDMADPDLKHESDAADICAQRASFNLMTRMSEQAEGNDACAELPCAGLQGNARDPIAVGSDEVTSRRQGRRCTARKSCIAAVERAAASASYCSQWPKLERPDLSAGRSKA